MLRNIIAYVFYNVLNDQLSVDSSRHDYLEAVSIKRREYSVYKLIEHLIHHHTYYHESLDEYLSIHS